MLHYIYNHFVAGSHKEKAMREALAARVAAFIQEFPFLKRYVKQLNRFSKRPVVQRIDLDLMDRVGWTNEWANKNLQHGENKFVLLGRDGRELGQALQTRVCRSEAATQNKIVRIIDLVGEAVFGAGTVTLVGETVGEAIRKLEDPDQVAFVMEIWDWLGYPSESLDAPNWGVEVTLYKVPSGRSLTDWLAHLQQVAEEELRGELATVNKA